LFHKCAAAQRSPDCCNARGKVREKYGKLTDDDYQTIAGKKDRFIGKLQERYGMSREQAEQELGTFFQGVNYFADYVCFEMEAALAMTEGSNPHPLQRALLGRKSNVRPEIGPSGML
jgi:uncharacterized protein YjbJ (UPF0337 family)